MDKRWFVLIGLCSAIVTAGTARAGTVTGVSVSPRSIVAGGTVTVTVTGTNPCGAAHIIWMDGTAITYAITGLPVSQTFTYNNPGTYTITAQGMGNCDGEARTSLTVTAPPAPAAPAAEITSVDMSPATPNVREPVTIKVNGTGTCTYAVQYGDGNLQDVTGPLPQQTRHTYSKADKYTVIVTPRGACTGRFTQILQVVPPSAAVEITGVVLRPTTARVREPVTITTNGNGVCTYAVQYGDGNLQDVTGRLPQQTRHAYAKAGKYTVIVTPRGACTGTFTQILQVVEPNTQVPQVGRLLISPTPADAGQPVTITVDGSGACSYTLDYGDGNAEPQTATLPARARHVYPAPGSYVLAITPDAPCTGSARTRLDVRDASRPGVTRIEVTPTPATMWAPAAIVLQGSGDCRTSIDFGDGKTQTVSGTLPRRVTHTYARPGRYTIEAWVDAPCTGDVRVDLEVVRRR